MKRKPIIGVVPLWDEDKNSIWMHPGYTDAVIRAGGLPIILPFADDRDIFIQSVEMCDGFLLTGGQDISPELYGDTKRYRSVKTCPTRDNMEEYILERAVELDKPLLGICRGLQLMNAVLGGTLYQHLPRETNSSIVHLLTPPYENAVHGVRLDPDSPLAYLLGKQRITVNSYHHQGIKELSPKLKCMARAEDRLVEAVYMPSKRFIWAVQWHPEMTCKSDNNSQKLFDVFVTYSNLCRKMNKIPFLY